MQGAQLAKNRTYMEIAKIRLLATKNQKIPFYLFFCLFVFNECDGGSGKIQSGLGICQCDNA